MSSRDSLEDKQIEAAKVWASVRHGLGLVVMIWVAAAMAASIAIVVPAIVLALRAAWGLL